MSDKFKHKLLDNNTFNIYLHFPAKLGCFKQIRLILLKYIVLASFKSKLPLKDFKTFSCFKYENL